jgi:WD40 repeat protein
VNCVAVSRSFIATGGTDTITNIWDIRTKGAPTHTIVSFRDEITNVAIGEEFGLVVSSTRNSAIFLISAGTGVITRVLDLAPEIPGRIMVTPGWGFIVVYSVLLVDDVTKGFLSLYTVNGEFVRKKELSFLVADWVNWVSPDGFDYMVLISDQGDLYACEVYYLDAEESFGKVGNEVIGRQFFIDDGILVIVTAAELALFPISQVRPERWNRTIFGTSS